MSRLVDLGLLAGWRVVRMLPEPLAAAAFRAAADAAARRRGPGVRRLAGNLRRVVGPDMPESQLDELVRDALRSYARYYLEAFRLPALSQQQRLRGFRLTGEEMLTADIDAGRGAVVALSHSANWDAAGAWVAAKGWKIVTVAERLKPERVYERFLNYRRALGMEILPLTGGDRPVLDVLTDRLRAGYVVPLLADRDLSARGVPVEFFGGRTRMPPGPALLAVRTGAPLYTASLWYEPDAVHAELAGPIAVPAPESGPLDHRVRELTQRIADNLAAGIARHPRDWHMLQRVWLDGGASNAGPAEAGPITAGPIAAVRQPQGVPGASEGAAADPPASGPR